MGRLFCDYMVGLLVTFSRRAYATGLLHPESLPYGRLLLTHTSAGDSNTGLAQTQDGVVEGRVLIFSCKNPKLVTHC